MEGWSKWASRTWKCGDACGGRPNMEGSGLQNLQNDLRDNEHNPGSANTETTRAAAAVIT